MSWIEDYNKSGRDEVGRNFVYAALGVLGLLMGCIALEQYCSKDNKNSLEKSIIQDTSCFQNIETSEIQDSINYKDFDSVDCFYKKE